MEEEKGRWKERNEKIDQVLFFFTQGRPMAVTSDFSLPLKLQTFSISNWNSDMSTHFFSSPV
jgi:hypothetical protein